MQFRISFTALAANSSGYSQSTEVKITLFSGEPKDKEENILAFQSHLTKSQQKNKRTILAYFNIIVRFVEDNKTFYDMKIIIILCRQCRVWSCCMKIKSIHAIHCGKQVGKNPFSKSRIISVFLSNLVLFIPRNIMIPFTDILDHTK